MGALGFSWLNIGRQIQIRRSWSVGTQLVFALAHTWLGRGIKPISHQNSSLLQFLSLSTLHFSQNSLFSHLQPLLQRKSKAAVRSSGAADDEPSWRRRRTWAKKLPIFQSFLFRFFYSFFLLKVRMNRFVLIFVPMWFWYLKIWFFILMIFWCS